MCPHSPHLDAVIDVPHLGPATVDVAYGGMFYVIAEAAQFGLRLTPEQGRDIVPSSAEMVKAAAAEQLPVTHPEQPGFSGVTIAELSGPPTHPDAHAKNVRDGLYRQRWTGTSHPPGPA